MPDGTIANAITATAVAAAGLVLMTMQDVQPVSSGPELRVFLEQQPATIADLGTLQAKFEKLANEWRRNTTFSSSVTDIVLDPNYQQIIGMGAVAVPLILNELKQSPEHWFWALAAITGADPAKNEPDGDIEAAAEAWIRWGVERGIIR
jgi:hypothetical protein